MYFYIQQGKIYNKMEKSKKQSLKTNLLIGLTGSVATIKIQQMIELFLQTDKFNIKVITTESAKHFFDFEGLRDRYEKVRFYEDRNEYQSWKKRGDAVVHIELRKWAKIFLVAPLSANTLAKFNSGICDNLVSLVFRCWDMTKNNQGGLMNPIVLCPSMNNLMYSHPLTEEHLKKMRQFGCIVIDSIQKVLMCGQKGKGAMEEVKEIVGQIDKLAHELKKDNQTEVNLT